MAEPSSQPPQPSATGAKIDPARNPLSQDQLVQLGNARLRIAKVMRAARVAHRAFVGLVFCGVITALLAYWQGFDIWAFIMGIWMTVAGIIEYIGAERIRRLRAGVFRMLRMNQLLLGAMFILIGGWWMLEVKLGWFDTSIQHDLAALRGAFINMKLMRQIVYLGLYITYGSIVAFGLIVQGFMSLYYIRRGRQLDAYLAETPAWIIDLQRSGQLG